MSGDTRRLLEQAGSREVPSPGPRFAHELEDRLVAVAASLPTDAAPPVRLRRRGVRWPSMRVGAVVVIAVVAVAIGFGLGRGRPSGALVPELARPVNVEVSLPDGTVLADPDGMALPEGAVIVVGDDGSARIGDTVLGPGDVVTVREGQLHVEHRPVGVVGPAATRTPRPTPERTRRPSSAPDATSSPTPEPTRSPGPTPRPTPRPTPTATAAPDRTPAPTSVPQPTDAPAPTAAPTPTPTPTPAIVRPRLRGRLIVGTAATRVALRWTETYRARSYVLLVTASRTGTPPDPVYPGSRVLGTFDRPQELPVRFRVPERVVGLKFRVIALRGNGTVLRRSNIVSITIPPPTD